MENVLKDVASRIRTLREIREISVEEMATATGTTVEAYRALEEGNTDFSFTFIYKCAARLGVETVDLLAGESATLNAYCVNRAGNGLPIARRQGFSYNNIAPRKDRGAVRRQGAVGPRGGRSSDQTRPPRGSGVRLRPQGNAEGLRRRKDRDPRRGRLDLLRLFPAARHDRVGRGL